MPISLYKCLLYYATDSKRNFWDRPHPLRPRTHPLPYLLYSYVLQSDENREDWVVQFYGVVWRWGGWSRFLVRFWGTTPFVGLGKNGEREVGEGILRGHETRDRSGWVDGSKELQSERVSGKTGVTRGPGERFRGGEVEEGGMSRKSRTESTVREVLRKGLWLG